MSVQVRPRAPFFSVRWLLEILQNYCSGRISEASDGKIFPFEAFVICGSQWQSEAVKGDQNRLHRTPIGHEKSSQQTRKIYCVLFRHLIEIDRLKVYCSYPSITFVRHQKGKDLDKAVASFLGCPVTLRGKRY